MKLSRRKRYHLKWNGPDWNKRARCNMRSQLGKSDRLGRFIAAIHLCRHQGYYPGADKIAQMSGWCPNKRERV